jgi:DNA polymerase-3 subunit beta
MKLTVSKEALAAALGAVGNVAASRTTLPVLSNVLLKAEGNRLTLTGTDLDLTVTTEVEAEVAKPGAVTLPAKRLAGIVRELGAPALELEVDEKSTAKIVAGSAYFRVNGLPDEEFPPQLKFKESRSATLTQEALGNMLALTTYAVSEDTARFVLNGILFTLKEGEATLVATDGRRLAIASQEAELPKSAEGSCIVPDKAVKELARMLGKEGDVELRFTENQAHFRIESKEGLVSSITSKLIDGSYPNYKEIIPKETKHRVALAREEILAAVRRAELMTTEKSNSVKLEFTKNQLVVSANSAEVGEAKETVPVKFKGEVALAFNPQYFMDPLKALSCEEVFLELSDELSPGVIKINGPFLYVLMPMRLS